jgi:tRNA pseudouridine38-40 synthase
MQFRMVVEYDGTGYAGWQTQPDARTVQATLEEALARLLGHATRVTAAGRTDAGVHALAQVVSFHTSRAIAPDTVYRAVNALTPADLAVRAVDVVADSFDPRRSAALRVYVYRIWNRAAPSPFWRRWAWHVRPPLAVERMNDAAAHLLGEHDFTSFRAAGCEAAHAVRRVGHSRFARQGDLLSYRIEATAFLRHMVRNVVGTLVEVGLGRRAADEVRLLLVARDRTLAGVTAPAHGLCLAEVRYENAAAVAGNEPEPETGGDLTA